VPAERIAQIEQLRRQLDRTKKRLTQDEMERIRL